MLSTDELIERVLMSSRVPGRRQRQEIRRELRSHIEDFVDQARQHGHQDHEIEEMVAASFGDPTQIAREFARVYRLERAAASAGVFLASTLAVTSVMLCAILLAQAGIAIGFGNPVRQVIASPHTAIEALDISFTVVTYTGLVAVERLFNRNRSWKALGLLALAFAIVTAVRATVHVRAPFVTFGVLNGAFFRTIQIFVKNGAARTGVVAAGLALVGTVSLHGMTLRFPNALAIISASWVVMAMAYRYMADAVARIDAVLSHRLQQM